VDVGNNQSADLTAPCNSDEIVVGGGFDGTTGIQVTNRAFPEPGNGLNGAGGSFKVSVKATGNSQKATPYAICMKITNA